MLTVSAGTDWSLPRHGVDIEAVVELFVPMDTTKQR
jgi:hypothetical protein